MTETVRPRTASIGGDVASRFVPAAAGAAEAAFQRRFPDFDPDGSHAALRRAEYGRLDAEGHVYLDFTGGGLPAASHVAAHARLLQTRVFGNPHSNNPTSRAMTQLVEQTRRIVCDHFRADPDQYACIFTANASAALRLVGESYPFAPGGAYGLTFDNHNSVNGIREFARRRGASIAYVPVNAPELRVDRAALERVLGGADPAAHNLFAFPAQSNFSGVQHPLGIVDDAHEAGWDVLLDAAAFAPSNRLDLDAIRPEFVTLSFYKIIGYPTGVGCLLVRKAVLGCLGRPWFAGGTVTIASVQGDGHYLHDDESGFEDGTVDYLSIPAVGSGLQRLAGLGIDVIHARVMYLTTWLLDALTGLRHSNGRPLVQIHGPCDTVDRGGSMSFVLRDPEGRLIDDRRVEELANAANISLRTGCFCNPGAGEAANGLTASHMTGWFHRPEPVSFPELREELAQRYGIAVAAIRISLGIATTFADVYRFMSFMQGFVDRSVDAIGQLQFASAACRVRDSA